MDKLIDATILFGACPTYFWGDYDDSHEWTCECNNIRTCTCRAYDLDDRDEDEFDRELAAAFLADLEPAKREQLERAWAYYQANPQGERGSNEDRIYCEAIRRTLMKRFDAINAANAQARAYARATDAAKPRAMITTGARCMHNQDGLPFWGATCEINGQLRTVRLGPIGDMMKCRPVRVGMIVKVANDDNNRFVVEGCAA